MKKNLIPLFIAIFLLILVGCSSGVPQEDYDALLAEKQSLESSAQELEKENQSLADELEEEKNKAAELSIEEPEKAEADSSPGKATIKTFGVDYISFIEQLDTILESRGIPSVSLKDAKVSEEDDGLITHSIIIGKGCFMYISVTSDDKVSSVSFAQFVDVMTEESDAETTDYITSVFHALAPNSDIRSMLDEINDSPSGIARNSEIVFSTSYLESEKMFSTFMLPAE